MSIEGKEDLDGLREAGRIVRAALEAMKQHVRPGITTAELNAIGAEVLRKNGARSAPMLVYGFPREVCISINEEIIHGIPSERVVEAGETNGAWDCVHCWEASDHCPFDIDPTHRIMELRDRSIRLGVKSGTGNRQATRHYNAFERSVEHSGWLDERNVAIQSYGGLIKGGLKMMPTGLRALRRGKANLLPHRKRPGASAIKALFARYREVTRTER